MLLTIDVYISIIYNLAKELLLLLIILHNVLHNTF